MRAPAALKPPAPGWRGRPPPGPCIRISTSAHPYISKSLHQYISTSTCGSVRLRCCAAPARTFNRGAAPPCSAGPMWMCCCWHAPRWAPACRTPAAASASARWQVRPAAAAACRSRLSKASGLRLGCGLASRWRAAPPPAAAAHGLSVRCPPLWRACRSGAGQGARQVGAVQQLGQEASWFPVAGGDLPPPVHAARRPAIVAHVHAHASRMPSEPAAPADSPAAPPACPGAGR